MPSIWLPPTRLPQRLIWTGSSALVVLLAVAGRPLVSLGAGLILHPPRRAVAQAAPASCHEVTFAGAGVTLKGWRGPACGERRGTLVYLHGMADNRGSGVGVFDRFRRRGFDVIAYDSRAHGESGGTSTTYGFFEKHDLRRVIDTLDPGPIVLVGSSLGAAVALQMAAEDSRISAVVAAEPFSDLRTVVTERAPFFFSHDTIGRALELAEQKAQFVVEQVNPATAARTITAPVLLVHGEADTDTPPDHSRRVFDALAGPKRLLLVPGARHNESLQGNAWEEIERWLDAVLVRVG